MQKITTTMNIETGTKSQIDVFCEYKNESYDEVIKNPSII